MKNGERLGKTDQTASTLIVKLNTSSLVVREEVENPQDVKKYKFKVAPVTMAFHHLW